MPRVHGTRRCKQTPERRGHTTRSCATTEPLQAYQVRVRFSSGSRSIQISLYVSNDCAPGCYRRQSGVEKLSHKVDFDESIDLSDYGLPWHQAPIENHHQTNLPLAYRLHAVIVHQGQTPQSGHYCCYVRAPSEIWYQVDDDTVRQVSLQRVLQDQAYLLFYMRVVEPTTLDVEPAPSERQHVSSCLVEAHVPATTDRPEALGGPAEQERATEGGQTRDSSQSMPAPSLSRRRPFARVDPGSSSQSRCLKLGGLVSMPQIRLLPRSWSRILTRTGLTGLGSLRVADVSRRCISASASERMRGAKMGTIEHWEFSTRILEEHVPAPTSPRASLPASLVLPMASKTNISPFKAHVGTWDDITISAEEERIRSEEARAIGSRKRQRFYDHHEADYDRGKLKKPLRQAAAQAAETAARSSTSRRGFKLRRERK